MLTYGAYWLEKLPDMLLSKYQAFAQSSVDELIELQTTSLRQWASICCLYRVTLHYIIAYDPVKPNGNRLDIGVVIQGEESMVNSAEKLLFTLSLRHFYNFIRDDERLQHIGELPCHCCNALTKNSRELQSKFTEMPLWFIPEWEVKEDASMVDLFKTMETIDQPCVYRVDVYCGNYTTNTRSDFMGITDNMRQLVKKRENLSINGAQLSLGGDRDRVMDDAIREYDEWIKKIETTPHMLMNVFAYGATDTVAQLLLHSVGSSALDKGEYSVVPHPELSGSSVSALLSHQKMQPVYCLPCERFPTRPQALRAWPISYTFEEASCFLRFPALYEGEVVQLPKETAPSPEATGMKLGIDMSGHDVIFPINQFTKHAFVCGVPGAGKTNTMLHITSTLWKKYRIPFLVFEPAKKEYRALLNDPDMKDVLLFSPKASSTLPIAINPFEFPKGLTLSEHISSLMQIFSSTFDAVTGGIWYFLNASIEAAYYELGWSEHSVNEIGKDGNSLSYPRLSRVIEIYSEKMENSGYDGEVKANMKTFLQARLGSLVVRELGDVFDVEYSTMKPDDWLRYPAILELEALEKTSCNFFILLLCTIIRENLRVNPTVQPEHGLRHVVFIEEAHNLLAPQTEQQSAEAIDPKVSATAYIVKMLAEVRALKEGIVIADQLPSVIAPEVMKNTGLKVVHRMTAQDDRMQVGGTMSATPVQLEHLVTFLPGEAMIFYEGLMMPFKTKINQWENGRFSDKNQDDASVTKLLQDNREYIQLIEATIEVLKDKLSPSTDILFDKCCDIIDRINHINIEICTLIQTIIETKNIDDDLRTRVEYCRKEWLETYNDIYDLSKEIEKRESIILSLLRRFPYYPDSVCDEQDISWMRQVKEGRDIATRLNVQASEKLDMLIGEVRDISLGSM